MNALAAAAAPHPVQARPLPLPKVVSVPRPSVWDERARKMGFPPSR